MKYAVLSDSHDHIENLETALDIISERGIGECFHLGDFCRPKTIERMLERKGLSWTCVWGNMDPEAAQAHVIEKKPSNFDIVGADSRVVDAGGSRVFLSHYPRLSRPAAESGEYDACFHGHTHQKYVKKLENGTLLANPGEVEGSRTNNPTFGIWDAEANEMEIVELRKVNFL